MDASIWVALIVAVPTVLTTAVVPVVLNVLGAKTRAAEKKADNERQDVMAARVADVAKRAGEAAMLLSTNTAKVALVAQETNAKLDVIHTLVNSTLTTAMQTAYDANEATLIVLRRIIALGRAQGVEPSDADLKAMSETEAKLVELRLSLDDRLKAAVVVGRL